MSRKSLLWETPIIFTGVLALVFLLYSPLSDANPTVRWTPSSLYASLAAGESTTSTATFIPSANATNVTVRVVPSLAPYVSVSPTSFASLAKGATYSVTVTMTAPVDMVVEAYDGTIHLRQGNRTLAQPLPVVMEVVWPTFEGGEELGLSIQYPPGWYVESRANSVMFRNVAEPAPYSEWKLATESYLNVHRLRDVNPEYLPLTAWVDDYSQRLPTPVLSQQYTSLAGREAVRVVISELGGDRAHIYVADDVDILDVNFGLFEPLFIPYYEAILTSMYITE